jgi:tight adherence protein B
MIILLAVMFLVGVGAVYGVYGLVTHVPGAMAQRRLDKRLQEVSMPAGPEPEKADTATTVVARLSEGALPALDRIASQYSAGSWLTKLIEQAGSQVTPSTILVASVLCAALAAVPVLLLTPFPLLAPLAGLAAATLPFVWLLRAKSVRLKKFEEQFPEALDLLSRAIRAGHAFQTAMGMVADEAADPIGPEFKKTFDQQNYGLPLREALNAMSERVPLMDMHFFVTAVLIQRETGGNLSEILDNLARVVRERFKILRQVRVHTAHGRLTGYVLLALPAALGIALSFLNPKHMEPLFRERIGQLALMGAGVMQTIGYFWIKRVIKIEV